MDGRTDGRTDGWMDGWTDEWMGRMDVKKINNQDPLTLDSEWVLEL